MGGFGFVPSCGERCCSYLNRNNGLEGLVGCDKLDQFRTTVQTERSLDTQDKLLASPSKRTSRSRTQMILYFVSCGYGLLFSSEPFLARYVCVGG